MNLLQKHKGFVIVLIAVAVVLTMATVSTPSSKAKPISYSAFLEMVDHKEVSEVYIKGNTIYVLDVDNNPFTTTNPNDTGLINDLVNSKVIINVAQESSSFVKSLMSWIPLIVIFFIIMYVMSRRQAAQSNQNDPRGASKFGKNTATAHKEGDIKTRFSDVAGLDEAKDDVEEIVTFLKNPQDYHEIGGRIPRGLLMSGPPGTGKTMLARAIAGEAGVPFYSISGSDFVEMFVGVGASRVRDLFEEARKETPCIIFIDEIDAVGRKRGGGMSGGSDEREQTLNALLVEMDGFGDHENVIVIAASNRPDVLDKALLRPGRFDRQIEVPLPDVRGREAILKIYTNNVKIEDGVNLSTISKGTPGFSGADLENLINESALLVVRSGRKVVTERDIEKARDKIMMGAERKSLVMLDAERKITAYHEAGHAIVGCIVPAHDPVHKVSIVPRGRALGVTMYLPEEDRMSYSFERLSSSICSLYGGRIAEELIYGKRGITTGASNDIERATELASNMITKWGFSDVLGVRNYSPTQNQFGQESGVVGDSIHSQIDLEIDTLLKTNFDISKEILENNIDILHEMAEALMALDTIDSSHIKLLMDGVRFADFPT